VLRAWRRIPGPARDPLKARLLRLYVALEDRFGAPRSWTIPVGPAAVRQSGQARRLRDVSGWLRTRFRGSIARMRRAPLEPLRRELRIVPDLGPVAADTLLLYGAGRPVFVADASVRRVLRRHRLLPARIGYEDARRFIESHLPSDPVLLKEYHALLVAVAKTYCGSVPRCRSCPLRPDLDGRPPAG
jgi:endonuclease III-like uncharacterized protein